MRFSIGSAVKAAILVGAGAAVYVGQPGVWSKLANEGQTFTLSQSTLVRFGKGKAWVEKTLVAGGTCGPQLFDNVDPAPGVTKQCDRGVAAPPSDVGTPTVMNAGVQVADSYKWPTPPAGSTTDDVATGWPIQPHVTDDFTSGDQRSGCNVAKFAFNDPIVFPNQPDASHHHTFYGNTKLDAYTTVDNIRSLTGAQGTCLGGRLNLSGYWHPSLLAMKDSGGTKGLPLQPRLLLYYKAGNQAFMGTNGITGGSYDSGGWYIEGTGTRNAPPDITQLPLGLRMISGVASSSTPQSTGLLHYNCAYYNLDTNMADPVTGSTGPFDHWPEWCPHDAPSPTNPTGDPHHPMEVWMFVHFRQCWSGQLDSPNHRDHLADMVQMDPSAAQKDPGRQYTCPTGFPYVLPMVSIIPITRLPSDGGTDVLLASDVYAIGSDGKIDRTKKRGYSGHADWMQGWDESTIQAWTVNCLVWANRRNCGTGGLGDGRQLLPNHGNDGTFIPTPTY
jgi:hypothetical protein